MMIGFVMELFFTASLSLCLAFLFVKLVSRASTDGNEEVVLTSGKEEMSEFEEGAVVEKTRGAGGLRNQGIEAEEKIEFVGESVKGLEVMLRGAQHMEESCDLGILEKEKSNIVRLEDQLVEEKYTKSSSVVEDNLVVEIPKKEVGEIGAELEKQEEGIVKDEAVDAKRDNRESDREEEDKEGLFVGDDDWEGIEKTEVAKLFGSASKFVASTENNELLSKLGDETRMQLYGLHKVAMEGPCHEPPPMAIMVSARAKWNAWQRLGNMTPDVAMEEYLKLLSVGIPGWMGGDKCNVLLEAGEPRKESRENLPIHHQRDTKNQRKPQDPQSHGEGNDGNSS